MLLSALRRIYYFNYNENSYTHKFGVNILGYVTHNLLILMGRLRLAKAQYKRQQREVGGKIWQQLNSTRHIDDAYKTRMKAIQFILRLCAHEPV